MKARPEDRLHDLVIDNALVIDGLGLQLAKRTFGLPPNLRCSIRFRLLVGFRSEFIL